jgi:hypothetical protein
MDYERLLKTRASYDSPLKQSSKIVNSKKEMTPNKRMSS